MGEVKGSVLERLKGAFIKYVTLIGGFFDPLVLLNGCFTYNFRQSITKVCASPPPKKKYVWLSNGLVIKWWSENRTKIYVLSFLKNLVFERFAYSHDKTI